MKNSGYGCGTLFGIIGLIMVFSIIKPYLIIIIPILIVLIILLILKSRADKEELVSKENEKVKKLEKLIQENIDNNPEINISWVKYEDSNYKNQIPKSVYLEKMLSKMEDEIYQKKLKIEEIEEERKILQDKLRKSEIFNQKLDDLSSKNGKFTPKEIIDIMSSPSFEDFTGIYIIKNEDNNKIYVGQAKKVISRIVTQHLEGKGNPDVYADYRYGANQTIQTLSLAKSGYESLDKLEKDYIARYDSFINGYNKTNGNKN